MKCTVKALVRCSPDHPAISSDLSQQQMQAHTLVVSTASNKASLLLTLLFAQENKNSTTWTPLEGEKGAVWFHGVVERHFIFAELMPDLPMWGWTGCVGWRPAGEQQGLKKPTTYLSGNPAWLRLSHLPWWCWVVRRHICSSNHLPSSPSRLNDHLPPSPMWSVLTALAEHTFG